MMIEMTYEAEHKRAVLIAKNADVIMMRAEAERDEALGKASRYREALIDIAYRCSRVNQTCPRGIEDVARAAIQGGVR